MIMFTYHSSLNNNPFCLPHQYNLEEILTQTKLSLSMTQQGSLHQAAVLLHQQAAPLLHHKQAALLLQDRIVPAYNQSVVHAQ